MKAALFKGATRPACFYGVPLTAFVLTFGFFIFLGFVIWMPLLLLYPFVFFSMRKMTEKDDQIFHQIGSNLKLNIFGNPNRRHWKGVTSLAPKSMGRETVIVSNMEV